MATSAPPAPPPPPPPPPPSAVFGAKKILVGSQRPPAHRNDVGSIRPAANTQGRSPLAKIHPEALQHAAANLRKTQYRESLLSSEPSTLALGRPDFESFGGHWTSDAKHDKLGYNSSRETLSPAYSGAYAPLPPGQYGGQSLPLNNGGSGPPPRVSPTPPRSGQLFNDTASPSPQSTLNVSPPSSRLPNIVSPTAGKTTSPYTYSSIFAKNYSSPTIDYFSPQTSPASFSSNGTTSRGYSTSTTTTTTTTSTTNGAPPPPPPPLQDTPNYPPPPPPSSSPPRRYFGGDQYQASLISNPQDYIHRFATQTTVHDVDDLLPTNQQRFASQVKKPYNFAQELRDSTLTDRQKYANQFQRSPLADRLPPQAVAHIYNETIAATQKKLAAGNRSPAPGINSSNSPSSAASAADQVDQLIRQMETKLRETETKVSSTTGTTTSSSSPPPPPPPPANNNHYDICLKCQKEIAGEIPGVTALGKPYHVSCFCCDVCSKQLAGCSFYHVDGKNLCQVDYMNSLDKCDKCGTPITQKILRAMGKAFHPDCFVCPECSKSLDGIPFTVDPQGVPYCVDCYHERFSPRCAACLKSIVPPKGETEVARIVALDRSYHVECYKCEDCGVQLSSKIEGQGCYPLESHLFCKACNLKRIKANH